MGKAKNKTQEEKVPAALNRSQIVQKLEEALAELKPALGDKKFSRRMKKAGKLISNGLPKKAKASRVKGPKAAPDNPADPT